MKLYTNQLSPNARKVHAVAHALGIELDTHAVDFRAGEHRTPDYLTLNPNGKVPTLVDGETTIWESNAIMCYLAGLGDNELWPKSGARYDILRWMFWESNHFTAAINQIIGQKIFNRDNPDQAIIEAGLKDFKRYAAVLDGALHGGHYLTGDTITLADYATCVGLGYASICELPLEEYPHVSRWWKGITDTASGQLLLPPH